MFGVKAAIINLGIGDIFHAESRNGASLICIVTMVTDTAILARTVTTQCVLEFGRQSGIAEWGTEPIVCTINSTAPLPEEVHQAILGIDRKFRLEQDVERIKLTDNEKRALIFVDSHYSSNRV